ncbi:hypothetical protein FKR81_06605 [Lentzea tibetensis]|uniref:Methyltransferase type 11 domain-containing protein n=1 Tax=Lentzea tibetensis TaxID=2591470 RepID=A0A563EYJ3_9PSEU|nr:hypothetical protein [Lentzea tibetensis]TWP52795.1 hypothetical protein FKR81_06605 [Lentzea tibetensis]
MSEARLTDALVRLDQNKELRLPLRSRDLLGRLALKFLWRRQVKWQVETNNATRDGLDALRQLVHELPREELANEVERLKQADQNIMAGLNQRLYAAVGSLRTDIGDLRLQLVDKGEHTADVERRLAVIEEQLAELTGAARDTRLRHAQVDLFLDQVRGRGADGKKELNAPDRSDSLELPIAELLDGPAERVRTARAAYLPVVEGRGPVFDVAPSRGEWLEVLREAGVPAAAASANPFVVKHNAELGFQLVEADPLDALARVDRRSLGAVTAFRFVERRDPATLSRFVDLAAQALRPGGVLLIESAAGGDDFHLDPFAQRPVHPTFLRFLAEAAGFGEVRIARQDGSALAASAPRFSLTAWM